MSITQERDSAFWMVIATQNGTQTPYNFQTQDKAEQFLQSLAGDAKIDGVQLMKMQSQSGSPVTYQVPMMPNEVAKLPVKGRRVQPKLLQAHNTEWNAERLKIPELEWAGHGSCEGRHRYEFIGHVNALIALGCVEHHMLDVGVSGIKNVSGYETQSLANDRFRLVLNRDAPLDEADLRATQNRPARRPSRTHDPISTGLRDAAILIRKYPRELREKLSAGICESNGNGWQLLESFPLLAVLVFTFNDRPARSAKALVRQGAKTREIAEAVEVPMFFKRFMPQVIGRLLKVHASLSRHPNVVSHHCPQKVTEQSSWLVSISKGLSSGSEDFAIWLAVHWQDLREKEEDLQQIRSVVCDLRD